MLVCRSFGGATASNCFRAMLRSYIRAMLPLHGLDALGSASRARLAVMLPESAILFTVLLSLAREHTHAALHDALI